MTFRYAVQRALTWQWLDFEAPLETDGPEWALNSYGILEGTLTPQAGGMIAEDGRPVYEEWGTLIHAETGDDADRRRWTGIVTRSELAGGRWKITCLEWPAFLKGVPVERKITAVEMDPANIVALIWQYAQQMPQSNIGVKVDGTTPLSAGTTSTATVAEKKQALKTAKAELDAATKAKSKSSKDLTSTTAVASNVVALARDAVTDAQQVVKNLIVDKAPDWEVDAARATVTARQKDLADAQSAYALETSSKKTAVTTAKSLRSTWQIAYDLAQAAYDAAVEQERLDGGAVVIDPIDLVDAHKTILDLASEYGFDWTTVTTYSAGAPDLTVKIHYPAAGRVRDDLVFEQGVNITSELRLERGGDDYANAAVGVGAGEGKQSIRQRIENTTPRLRRPAIIEDKSLRRDRQLLAALREELAARSGKAFVPEITVTDHPLTRIGAWNVGDTITIIGDVPNWGRWSGKQRIKSWQMLGDGRARIRF